MEQVCIIYDTLKLPQKHNTKLKLQLQKSSMLSSLLAASSQILVFLQQSWTHVWTEAKKTRKNLSLTCVYELEAYSPLVTSQRVRHGSQL